VALSIWCVRVGHDDMVARATPVALRAVRARNARVEADSILSGPQDAAIEGDVEGGHRPWTGASRR
jgi:hypothetical protein